MKTINTMKNNIELRAGKSLVMSWLLRGLFLLPTLFILGVGQMWGADASSATIIYDNTASNWSNVQLLIGHGSWSSVYSMTRISNTNLYYLTNFSWGGYTEFYFVTGCSGWGDEGNSPTNRKGYAGGYSAKQTTNLGSNKYTFTSSGTSNGASLTSGTTTAYSGLNYTQTLNQQLSTDGGSTYSASTANLATVSVSSYKLTSYTASTSNSGTISSGNSSTSCTAAKSAVVTYSVNSVVSGYTFVGWYDGSTQKSTSTTYTYNATSAKTITARFMPYSLVVAKGTGVSSVTGTTSPVSLGTKYDISATMATGYTFNTWTASPVANGTFDNASSASTKVKVQNGSVTVTASATERKSTITVTTATSSQGTLKFGSTSKSWGTTASVGVATTQSITATAAAGFTFVRWDLSGAATTASPTTSATITLKADGSGNTGTATAVFAEDLTTIWYLTGTMNSWSTTANKFTKNTGESTGSVAYTTATLSANTTYQFGVNNGSDFYANNNGGSEEYYIKGTVENWTFNKDLGYGVNCYMKSTLAGTYTFKIDFSGSNPLISVYYPSVYAISGGFNSWTETTNLAFTGNDGTYSVSINGSSTNYEFKVLDNGSWYGHTNKIFNGTESNVTLSSPNNNIKLKADVYPSGTYTFAYNKSTHKVGVTYPANFVVNFGKRTGGNTITAKIDNTTSFNDGTKIASGTSVTFAQTAKTGYTFEGWYNASSGGTRISTSASYTTTVSAATKAYANYTANSYTITLDVDEDHKGTIAGATTSQTIHFDETTTTIPNRPTGEQSYGLEGYFTDHNGNGTKLINGDGTWIASVAGYTDANKKWVHDGDVTLYAYYKKATISAITLTPAATVAPSTTVTATPVISPTPTGPVIVCWRLLHSNGNIMDEQPTFTPGAGNAVSFTAPDASSTYKVACILRTGSVCGAGSVIDSTTVTLQTAGDHTVTVQYKDTFNNTLQTSTSLVGINPLEWSSNVVAPSIFGYTFLRWVATDGVTIKDCANDTCANETIKIKANYDGKLKAEYVQKNIIYFKNTLGWSSVYVNLLDGDYWGDGGNANKGSGNKNKTNRNLAMSLVAGTTDIYYYDYGNKSTTQYVSFTQESMDNYEFFSQSAPNVAHVVFPTRNSDALTTNKNNDNGFYAKTPMFVPRAGQTGVMQNNNRAAYYNEGYWTKYTPGTGYSLKIYNAAGNALLKDIPFTSEDELMPMTAVVDLEATTTYKFELMREGDVYYGNDNAMTYTNHGQDVPWEMSWKEGGHKCGLTTNAAGEYTFHLTYSAYSNQYRLRMSYDYPIATGDYRVIYKDNVHTLFKPSAIVPKVNNGKDTVSFFIRPGDTPVMKIQQATVNSSTGVVTWSAGTDITSAAGLTSLSKDSVYNICLQMNGSGAISVENVEGYTGNFYIRVDCANNKWDNFKNADHALTYSEYSETYSDYTHYWMAHTWRNDNTNIKFVIANDYSPCISDTMIRSNYRGSDEDFVSATGVITPEANIRFMWNKNNNTINRAYLSPAKKDGSQFLVLRGYNGGSGDKDDNLLSEADTELEGNPGDTGTNNHAGGDHCMQFTDNENWIYEALVKVKPDTYVKLFARFAITINNETELPVTYTDLYYKGDSGDNFNGSDDDSDGIPNAIKLITGSGDHLLVRVIYDFKTDRLLAAYIPSGNITEEMEINADVMFIREHQGDISQVTFSGSGAIKEINTAYAVMRFNKWTLNNKSTADGHAPLGVPLSRYERDLFYISFPFDVNLNEVFGFGTYGVHWIIEEYDGAGRAQKGFWQDSPTFWKFITNRNGKVLKKNVGYLLALDLDELGEDAAVWGVAENDRAELFFPSSGTMPNITNSSVTDNLPEHTCTIIRGSSDRRIADSHWNIMGVPTYVNTKNVSFANTVWTTAPRDPATGHFGGPNFLYTWNSDDNTLTPTSAKTFTYHAMHAYTVQYCGNVTWTTSVSPSAIIARQHNAPNAYEWCLEIQQNDQMIDRTYVRMTDEEDVTTGFEFGYDMSKDLNKNKAGIYSFITTAESTEMAAGNCLPLETEQTTLVPLGVVIPTTGDYTFAMPAGTSGVGVTLIDNEAGVHTNLSALDYTVNLTAGDYTNRFFLEIPPVQPIHTDIEDTGDGVDGNARKMIIDGLLYIVRDGKMYDARGVRVE